MKHLHAGDASPQLQHKTVEGVPELQLSFFPPLAPAPMRLGTLVMYVWSSVKPIKHPMARQLTTLMLMGSRDIPEAHVSQICHVQSTGPSSQELRM